MKKRMLPVLLVLLLLAGCASMLDRDYVSVEPHDQFSDTGTDSSALRAENYQGLINAVMYLVSQGADHGVIRLYNYTNDVDTDLNRACLEVATEDPLGAYAVDYIKYDYSRIISYYEANVQITYRRTPEQIKNVVSVTGSSAIKDELRQALTKFSPEVVLRVSYLAEDENYIVDLVRQAYYDTPGAALGMPEAAVMLYPGSGFQRIVEINLTYSDSADTLRQIRNALTEQAEACLAKLDKTPGQLPDSVYNYLRGHVLYEATEEQSLSTAYAALVEGQADSEGFALAYQLLYGLAGGDSLVVYGTLAGNPHFWNLVNTADGWLHVDAARSGSLLLTSEAMQKANYDWTAEDYPTSTQNST